MAGFWDSFSRGYHSTPSGLQKGIQMGMREEAKKRLQSQKMNDAVQLQRMKEAETKTALPYDPGLKQKMDYGTTLRKEYNTQTGRMKDIDAAFGKVYSSSKKPDAAGDLSMIFNYMKMLDPGSVVRESEFRSAEAAKGWLSNSGGILKNKDGSGIPIPSFLQTMIQKADPNKKGAFLLPEQRASFVNRALDFYDGEKTSFQKTLDTYKGITDRYGINQKDVITWEPGHDSTLIRKQISDLLKPKTPGLKLQTPKKQSNFKGSQSTLGNIGDKVSNFASDTVDSFLGQPVSASPVTSQNNDFINRRKQLGHLKRVR